MRRDLPKEAGILGLWDTSVPIISGTCTDTVCLSLPQHGLGELVSVPGCDTCIGYFIDKLERPGHGLKSSTWLIGPEDFRGLGYVSTLAPMGKSIV